MDPQFNESTRLGLGYDLLKQFHAAKKELNRSSYTATEKSNSTRSRLLKQYWPSATAPGKSPSEQCRKVTHGMHEDADLIALMRVRSNGLRDRLYGAESIVYLPPNITSYTTRKFPCKLRIAPKVIVMDKKDAKGHLIPKRIHVLIAGKNLKSVDFRDISVLGGKAAKITRPPSFIGGAIELQVTITKAGVPIAFKLPLKGRPRSVYLITPPIIGMPTKKCLTKIINRNVYLITPPIIGN